VNSTSTFSNKLLIEEELKAFSTINSQENIGNFNNTLVNIQKEQKKILNNINKQRKKRVKCGEKGWFGPTHPLTWSNKLYTSALEHSLDLALSDTFAHDGSGTQYDITGNGKASKFYERIIRQYHNYYAVGENIAGGQTSLDEVITDWMESPEHCANIMSSQYTEIGVAIVENDESMYRIYWTQNFGSKQR